MHLFFYWLSLLFHWFIKLNSIFYPNVYHERMIKIVPSGFILVHVCFKVPFMSHARNLKKKTWSCFRIFFRKIFTLSLLWSNICRSDLCIRLKLDMCTSEEMCEADGNHEERVQTQISTKNYTQTSRVDSLMKIYVKK